MSIKYLKNRGFTESLKNITVRGTGLGLGRTAKALRELVYRGLKPLQVERFLTERFKGGVTCDGDSPEIHGCKGFGDRPTDDRDHRSGTS